MIYLDYLGTPLNLYYNNSSKFKTKAGSLLSILILLASILIFVYLGIDIIQKDKPSSYMNEEKIENPRVNSSQLFFAMEISDMYGMSDPDVLLKFSFKIQTLDTRGAKPVFNFYNMIPCNQSSQYNKMKLITKNPNFFAQGLFCLPENVTFDIIGNSEEYQVTYFNLLIQECDNNTYNCLSQDNVKEKTKNFMISIFQLDHYIQINNFTNPIQDTILELTFPSTPDQQFVSFIKLSTLDIKTDDGFLVERYKTEESFQRSSVIQYSLSNRYFGTYALIQIGLTGIRNVYYREYIKIQTVLANTSGLINVLAFFFSAINSYLSTYDMTFDIYSKLKNFKNNEKEIENKHYDNNSQQLKTESNLFKNCKDVLVLPELTFKQKLILLIPGLNSTKEIKSEYQKMREIIENSLDYVSIIKLNLSINNSKHEIKNTIQTEPEYSKSLRSNQILVKSMKALKQKSTSEIGQMI